MSNRAKALLCVAAGNAIFGFSFLFSRLALDITIPSVLLAVRFTAAFLVLNIIAAAGKMTGKIDFSLRGKPLKYVFFLALFQPCIYFICENYGILLTSTSFAGTIIAAIPIMGIAFDVILMKSRVSRKQVICSAVSVIGVIITSIGGEMKISMAGIAVLLGAVAAASLFYVFSKMSGKYFNPLEQTYVMFGFGSVVYIIIALVQCSGNYQTLIIDTLHEPVFFIAVVYLSVVSSVIAFLLINYGNIYISVSESSLLCNLTTVITILAGVLILKESFTVQQVAGAMLILGSVYVISKDSK